MIYPSGNTNGAAIINQEAVSHASFLGAAHNESRDAISSLQTPPGMNRCP